MNVIITGSFDNTVVVDTDLFEDVKLLQTGLSSWSDNFFNLVEEHPITYAILTLFSDLSSDYEVYKINNNTNISILHLDIENIENNYVTNTSLSTLATAIDDLFKLTTTYIDEKAVTATTGYYP